MGSETRSCNNVLRQNIKTYYFIRVSNKHQSIIVLAIKLNPYLFPRSLKGGREARTVGVRALMGREKPRTTQWTPWGRGSKVYPGSDF